MAGGFLMSEDAVRKLVADHRKLEQMVRQLAKGNGRTPPVWFGGESVPFKNGANEEAPAYGIMEPTGGENGFRGQTVTIGKPSTTFRRLYLVNGPLKVPAGQYGFGTWLMDNHGGPVLYASGDGTPAIGESWGAKASQWTLAKNRPGFLITAANNTSATAPYTSAVQYVVNSLIGKSDADISKGSSGTISIWMGTPGSETDTTMNVTAYANGVAIEGTTAKWVSLKWTNGAWYCGCWES